MLLCKPYPTQILIQQNFSAQGDLTEESPFGAHRYSVLKSHSEVELALWALGHKETALSCPACALLLVAFSTGQVLRVLTAGQILMTASATHHRCPGCLASFLTSSRVPWLSMGTYIRAHNTPRRWATEMSPGCISQSQIQLPGALQSPSCMRGYVTSRERKDFKKLRHNKKAAANAFP